MAYWEFSWSEMGKYDIPTILEYIKDQTGQDKVAYVGHSMGTTAMFYLMATDYETFKEHVSVYVALAPVAKLSATSSPLVRMFGHTIGPIKHSMELYNIYELFTYNWFTHGVLWLTCGYIPDFCYSGLTLSTDKEFLSSNHKRF